MKRKRPMRVLVLGPTPPPCHGVSLFTELVLDSLRSSGAGVIHIETSTHQSRKRLGAITFSNIAQALRCIVATLWTLLTRQPGILYLPLSQAGPALIRDYLLIWLGAALGTSTVVHLHGSSFAKSLPAQGILSRLLATIVLPRVDVAIFLSNNLRTNASHLFPNARHVCVPNTAPAQPIGPPSNVQRKAPADGPLVVGYIGTLTRRKGILALAQSVVQINADALRLRVRLAGNWYRDEDRIAMQSILQDSHASAAFEFLGEIHGPAKTRFFQEIDFCVFPFRQEEGAPLSLLEAMAHGVPSIVTDTGAVSDLLQSESEGIIVPMKDDEALLEAIRRLVKSPSLRHELGAAAARAYWARFTNRMFVQRFASSILPSLDSAAAQTVTSNHAEPRL